MTTTQRLIFPSTSISLPDTNMPPILLFVQFQGQTIASNTLYGKKAGSPDELHFLSNRMGAKYLLATGSQGRHQMPTVLFSPSSDKRLRNSLLAHLSIHLRRCVSFTPRVPGQSPWCPRPISVCHFVSTLPFPDSRAYIPNTRAG
jgi:hypothetical protein